MHYGSFLASHAQQQCFVTGMSPIFCQFLFAQQYSYVLRCHENLFGIHIFMLSFCNDQLLKVFECT